MSVSWQSLRTYPQNTYGLFWVDNGVNRYALYGVLKHYEGIASRRICDLNGAVYALEDDIVCWAECDAPGHQKFAAPRTLRVVK